MHYGIRKSSSPYENMIDFLRVDKQYSNLILFKKMVKTLEVFNTNSLFMSIGLKVRLLLHNFIHLALESEHFNT